MNDMSIESAEHCLFASGVTIGRVVSSDGRLAMAVKFDGDIGGKPSEVTVVMDLRSAHGVGRQLSKVAREWHEAAPADTGGEA